MRCIKYLFYGLLIPVVASPLLIISYAQPIINTNILNDNDFNKILKETTENGYPSIFLVNPTSVSNLQMYTIGLSDYANPNRNNSQYNDVFFGLSNSYYDYSQKKENNNLKYNSILNEENDILNPSNMKEKKGSLAFSSNSQDFDKNLESDNLYNLINPNGRIPISYINQLLNYYPTNIKFDLFIDFDMLQTIWYTNSTNKSLESIYKILQRANHIYLLSIGSGDWVHLINKYIENLKNDNIKKINNYDEVWESIFDNQNYDDGYNLFKQYSIFDFIKYDNMFTQIAVADPNYAFAPKNINEFKKYGFDYMNRPIYGSFIFFDYFKENKDSNEAAIDIINNFYNIQDKNQFTDFLIDVKKYKNNFDPNKKSLIIFLGEEIFTTDQSCIKELTTIFNTYLNKYGSDKYNIVLKMHPRYSADIAINKWENIMGTDKHVSFIDSTFPFELIVAKDMEYSLEHNYEGQLFDYNGHYDSSDFKFKSCFAGYEVLTTAVVSTLSMIDLFMPNKSYINDIKSLVPSSLVYIPDTFLTENSSVKSHSYEKNIQSLNKYLEQFYQIGLIYNTNSYKSFEIFTKVKKEDYYI